MAPADDCQVYVSVPVIDAAADVDRFSRCVADVSTWLSSSRLCLTPAKTVVIWLGGRHQVANIIVDNIPFLSSTVTTVVSARDLGVVVDSQLTMSANVSSTCPSAYHQLRQLRPVMLYAHCSSMLRRRLSSRSCQHAWTILQQSHVCYC